MSEANVNGANFTAAKLVNAVLDGVDMNRAASKADLAAE